MSKTKTKTFEGANVFMSRDLVPPEVFDAVHDAVKDNGAQIHICYDPSRNGANDYHVISDSKHEKFEDLKSNGCKMISPKCVLDCAKEGRPLPKQGFTCCLAMDGVKVLASGFDANEKIKIEELVTGMGGALNTTSSSDLDFVVVKNVLAAEDMYKWAWNILNKPLVTYEWLEQCSDEHRVVPHGLYKVLPFSGLKICASEIPADKQEEIEKHTLNNGGKYSAHLTEDCTHYISNAPEHDKHMMEKCWDHINIVTTEWFDQSIARRVTAQDQVAGICTVSQFPTQAVQKISEMLSQSPSQSQSSRNTENDSGVGNDETNSSILSPTKKARLVEENKVPVEGEDIIAAVEDLIALSNKYVNSSDCSVLGEDSPSPNPNPNPYPSGLLSLYRNEVKTSKEESPPTDSDSELAEVTYEEDFSGRQRLIDRVRDRR